MANGTHRVLVVGCGDLGSRHLQAVARVDGITEIEVIEPRPEAVNVAQRRLADVTQGASTIKVRWLSAIERATRGGDLCVIATQAAGRCLLTRQIAERLGYGAFLLEKVVAQSAAEYQDLLDFTTARGLSVWINCKTRAYPFHQRAKSLLAAGEPIVLSEIGGNHGLANNGVHTADLFVFYSGADSIGSAGSSIDAFLHPSKRGAEVFDLTGTLHGRSPDGSELVIAYQQGHVAPPCMTLASPRYRFVLDQMNRWAWESRVEDRWQWHQVPFEGDFTVSNMSRAFVADILRTGSCTLPTLADCRPAHEFVLGELLPHFKRLLSSQVQLCPVT